MKRVVVDTNIIISGTFWRGAPLTVLQGADDGLYTLLTSDELLEELQRTLSKRRFERVFAALGVTTEDVLALYQARAEKVTPAEIPPDAVRDAKDIPVLACAVGGKADVIVSGDKDLLSIGNYTYIPVLSAVQFLERRTAPPTESSTESPAE